MDISLDFVITCLLMGAGIAIDVVITTVTRFHRPNMTFKSWVIPITCTHMLFPAFGYFVFWEAGNRYPILSPILGLIGFIFIASLIYEVVCESIGEIPKFAPTKFFSEGLDKAFGMKEHDTRNMFAILAVSWDALWSGPALAASAANGDWSLRLVITSIILVGLFVFCITYSSLRVADMLRNKNFANYRALAYFIFWGTYAELSVIGGFGILSLWNGVYGEGNMWESIAVSAVLMAVIFFIFYRKMMESELVAAKEAISDEE